MDDHILKVSQVSKSYGTFTAVDRVSFTLKPGELVVLLGYNGAGKTTLLSMISGLINADSGDIAICGHDLKTHTSLAKMQLGICPQEINLNPFHSVEYELLISAGLYGLDETQATPVIDEYLKAANLLHKKHAMIRSLSGGMKRMVMVIRSLIHSPKLLLLDEPSAGVDVEIRKRLWSLIKHINKKGTCILLTTHNMQEAQELCQRVLLIHKGHLMRNMNFHDLALQTTKRQFRLFFSQPVDFKLWQDGFFQHHRQENPNCIIVDIDQKQTLEHLIQFLVNHRQNLIDIEPVENHLEQLLSEQVKS